MTVWPGFDMGKERNIGVYHHTEISCRAHPASCVAVNGLLLDVKWLEHEHYCLHPSSSEVRRITAPTPSKNSKGKNKKKTVMSGDLPLSPVHFCDVVLNTVTTFLFVHILSLNPIFVLMCLCIFNSEPKSFVLSKVVYVLLYNIYILTQQISVLCRYW
jgi:hypothetical protein